VIESLPVLSLQCLSASSIALGSIFFLSKPFGSGRLAEDLAETSCLYLKYFKITAILTTAVSRLR